MIRTLNGKTPKIADSAFVSEWAYVVGEVEIGENSGIWPGAVIRGDFGSIRIGVNTGPVVVGKIGDDLTMEYTAMGDTVNLAVRRSQSATGAGNHR